MEQPPPARTPLVKVRVCNLQCTRGAKADLLFASVDNVRRCEKSGSRTHNETEFYNLTAAVTGYPQRKERNDNPITTLLPPERENPRGDHFPRRSSLWRLPAWAEARLPCEGGRGACPDNRPPQWRIGAAPAPQRRGLAREGRTRPPTANPGPACSAHLIRTVTPTAPRPGPAPCVPFFSLLPRLSHFVAFYLGSLSRFSSSLIWIHDAISLKCESECRQPLHTWFGREVFSSFVADSQELMKNPVEMKPCLL
ncbi:Protein of unknown function [Gryllus bimaculatus]|nr:Protein of unknown function [Gryllus bimaculatus]